MFGKCTNATLSNIRLNGVYIRASDTAGSLAGSFSVNSNMENCHAFGVDIVATKYNIGGLVGELVDNSNMLRCSSHGAVSGTNQVGGLLGTPFNLTNISECYSTGTVNAQYLAGGLIGFSTFNFTPNRENTINNCYSRSNVSVVNGRVGGLCGGTDANLIIENSYSTGTATGPEFDGGFIGAVGSVSTTNNYWDAVTSSHANAVGNWTGMEQTIDITGKTTAEMKTVSMVELLNHNQPTLPWTVNPTINDGYPILSSMPVSLSNIYKSNVNVSVYPTVFNDYFVVESTSKLASYLLIDILGKTVQQGQMSEYKSRISTQSILSGT